MIVSPAYTIRRQMRFDNSTFGLLPATFVNYRRKMSVISFFGGTYETTAIVGGIVALNLFHKSEM